MELENSFVVPADIDTAWKTLLDVEAIADAVDRGIPPATLHERTSWSCHHGVERWAASCAPCASICSSMLLKASTRSWVSTLSSLAAQVRARNA